MEYPKRLTDYRNLNLIERKIFLIQKQTSIVTFSCKLYSGLHCWISEKSVPESFFSTLTNPFQNRGTKLSVKESNILKNEKMPGFSERTNLVIANHAKSSPNVFSKWRTSCWQNLGMIMIKIRTAERCCYNILNATVHVLLG